MDLTAKPLSEAIKIIESNGLNYEIIRINSDCGQNHIERVIRYYVSNDKVILTTAYFENDVRIKNDR